jgi:hypothetical protein
MLLVELAHPVNPTVSQDPEIDPSRKSGSIVAPLPTTGSRDWRTIAH